MSELLADSVSPLRIIWQDLALARQSPNEPFRAAGELFQKARGRQKLLTRYCRFHPVGGATVGLGAYSPKSERAIPSDREVIPKSEATKLLTRYCRFPSGASAGLGAYAPKSERTIPSGWGVAPKAKGRTMLLTRYCHTPEGAPGRTWRLRAKVRTSHFERLASCSKKRRADKSLPCAFWSY